MFVDFTVVSGHRSGGTGQVLWIDVTQILFYFGLVVRFCYASLYKAGRRYRCLDVTDMSCMLPAQVSSEQPVCPYRHSTHIYRPTQ
jgi:hypothetical protein